MILTTSTIMLRCNYDYVMSFSMTCTVHVSLLHSVCQCTVQTDMFLCVCISYTCVEACMWERMSLAVVFVYFLQVVKKPARNWKDMKCQKILKCGGVCSGLATKGNHIAVGVPNSIKVYDRSSTDLLHTIGKGQLGGVLPGVTFYDQEHILVSDYSNSNIKMFTIQGRHVRTIDRGSTTFRPYGNTISPNGHIYVCDVANHCVCVFDVNGKFLFSFGSRGSGDECFDYPSDLCFASDGFLYITDVHKRRICVYGKGGKFIRKFTTAY